ALQVLPDISADDIVVYELSSFQLWDLEKSPQVAVVLMIEADHLDVHQNMDDYVAAKAHITAHQTVDDTVVYYRDNQLSRQIAEASAAQRVAYPQPLPEAMQRAIVLPGAHNQDNASAAILAVRAVLPTIDEVTICRGLAAFTGLPHRLRFVREVNDVKFYDDSISTTPGSLLAALQSLVAPKVLIIGGHNKGADYQPMMSALASDSSVRSVVLVGSSAAMFTEKLMAAGIAQEKLVSMGMVPMVEAVAQAAAMAHPGDVVILSPAAASFDQYKSYVDRGQQFVAAVNQL
ncbi:MAG: UDP-N-acetylmuramoyl-L-alanine--D-glutamate ligase, partial [Candidatus Saccharibacteria bacterium]|nr:UDP-N-acetylmuramoyl-L-alanine--D-glutamate ligase [Candidatus Saccharibacteria bacterium]